MTHRANAPGALPLPGVEDRRKLVFHVGHFKTATTSIQNVLAQGLARSPGRRLLFPGYRNHMPLAMSLENGREARYREERFARLRQRLDRGGWDRAVVSSEQFEFVAPAALKAAIDAFLAPYAEMVRVIVYVRPHVPRLVSYHAERLKMGFTFDGLDADLERHRKTGLLTYAERLGRWRRVFGDRLLVRPFLPESLFRADAVADFFRLVFGSESFELSPTTDWNRTLSMQDLSLFREMLMRINARAPALMPAARSFVWDASEFIAALPQVSAPVRPAIDRALLERARDLYSDDAEQFDAMFWDRPLFTKALRDIAPVDSPLPVAAEAWHAPETLRIIHGFTDMLTHVLGAGDAPLLRAIQPEWTR